VGPYAGIMQAAAGSPVTVSTATTTGTNLAPVLTAAQNADFIVAVVGHTPYDEGEEYNRSGDRTSLLLDAKDAGRSYGAIQNNMVTMLAAMNKPMVVVIESGAVIDMPWLANVPAVVMAWYPGQVGGRALGKLLFGDENFSGKLPVTWPTSADQFPAFNPGTTTEMDYYLGYRRFDQMNLTPRYPFGHGLSYTTFKYENLMIPCADVAEDGVVNVSVDVTNTGPRYGEEIVMLFVSYPTTTSPRRSVKELKGFARVALDGTGQTTGCRAGNAQQPCAAGKRVVIPVRIKDLKYYDAGWKVQKGTMTVRVGPSAANLPVMGTFTVR
jgi:beta-glucosidase